MQDSSPSTQPQSIPEPVNSDLAPPQVGSTTANTASYNDQPLAQASEAIATALLQTVNNPHARLNQVAAIKAAYVRDQFGV